MLRRRTTPDAAMDAIAPGRVATIVSLVVPCFNEAACLPEFHRRASAAMAVLGTGWEILFVNDGSTDGSLAALCALRDSDPHVALLNLSRNFGKEIALTAGLDHAQGDAIVVIDADLQDPPELIPELVAAWREGYDMVFAQREGRAGESWLKRATAALFYRVMGSVGDRGVCLPRDTGDFRLLSRRAADAVLQLREQHRMMKGLFAWVGFPSTAVPYCREPRASGRTSWSYWRLWNLAIEGITGFTVLPLKLSTYMGLAVAFFAIAFGAQLVFRTLVFGNPVPGYPSLMAVILFLGGVQLTSLGVIGEYLGRIFNETKRRPLYLVECHLPSRAAGFAAAAEIERQPIP